MTSNTVSFVWNHQPLLSGKLDECETADDESCEGGIAAVKAYLRKYSDGIDKAALVITLVDYQSVFVQMHPLEWGVNRLILEGRYGESVFFAYSSFVAQNRELRISTRDLSVLQTNDFRPLLGNKAVASSNPWSEYVKSLHFDDATGLVVIPIDNPTTNAALGGSVQTVPQIEASRGLLTYIHQLNQALGCAESPTIYTEYLMKQQNNTITSSSDNNNNNNDNNNNNIPGTKCWIPMIAYEHTDEDAFDDYLLAVQEFQYRPAVIAQVRSPTNRFATPIQLFGTKIWVVSHTTPNRDSLKHIRMTISDDQISVTNVEMLEYDIGSIPEELKDETFRQDIDYLTTLRREAQINNPIRGDSLFMPNSVDPNKIEFKLCFGGECPLGNLFTDALRWKTGADFAFINSGGIRGQGWPEGPVRVSNIWDSLPFANTQCTGVISGINIFRIFDFATTYSTFTMTWSPFGDRLFQVSGIRYTYNTNLEAPRLVGLEIWNDDANEYQPVERLKLYKFATSSWMCSGFDPMPDLLAEEGLTIEGEEPSIIGDTLMQVIVGDYLSSLDAPYNTTHQGRLINNTEATNVLNFVQTEEGCNSTTYWRPQLETCWPCPSTEGVTISSNKIEFVGESGNSQVYTASGQIYNGADFPIGIVLKSSPDWVTFPSLQISTSSASIEISAGGMYLFDFEVTAKDLDAGLATGPISFAVLDAGSYPGCVGRDATFGVSMAISNTKTLITPEEIQIVGFTLVGIILMTTLGFGFWVLKNAENRVVKALQPRFLCAICFGVAVMGMSVVPLSIHGMNISERGQDRACMGTPWLLSMGFTIVMAALFTKLWRINKLFGENGRFRRITINEREAKVSFGVMFGLNFVLMLLWNLIDPMTYEIDVIPDEEWKLYGTCTNMDVGGWIFLGLTVGLNFFALVMACHEAYKARNISEDYSESKNLGLAMFSWIQILLVGVPVLFLMEDDNVNPKYFLQVSIIFILCLSMLFIIIVPIIIKARNFVPKRRKSQISGMGFSAFGLSSISLGELQSYFFSRGMKGNKKKPGCDNGGESSSPNPHHANAGGDSSESPGSGQTTSASSNGKDSATKHPGSGDTETALPIGNSYSCADELQGSSTETHHIANHDVTLPIKNQMSEFSEVNTNRPNQVPLSEFSEATIQC